MTTAKTARTVRGRGASRLLRLLALVARIVVLLVSVHVSGVDFVAGTFLHGDESSECCTPAHSDCPTENEGRGCPPGCPTCHGMQPSVALPPALWSLAAPRACAPGESPPAPYDTLSPHAPALPGPYRPPRLSASA